MARILLTGASGFLGWHLIHELGESHPISGTYFRQRFAQTRVNWLQINLLHTDQFKTLLAETRPDAVVHLAAIANLAFCQGHPALAHQINVHSSLALATEASKRRIPFLFASSDLVFNGGDAPYSEDSFAYPISRYGEQKLTAEDALLNDLPNTFVARLPLLFGWAAGYTKHFFRDWAQRFEQGEPISAFTDEYRTPISGYTAAEALKTHLEWALSHFEKPDMEAGRLLHFGGDTRLSRYDFGVQMAEALGYDPKHLQPCLRESLEGGHLRPYDTSLESENARQLLGYQPAPLRQQLQQLRDTRPHTLFSAEEP